MSRDWLLYLDWEVATMRVPRLLVQAHKLREQADRDNHGTDGPT